MANRLSILRNHRRVKTRRRKNARSFYWAASLLLITAGILLVFFILGLMDVNPFKAFQRKSGQLSPVHFSPSVLYWEESILHWAEAWSLDPHLVATVMQIESCGDPTAISPAGAQGLFQVMPYHFFDGEDPLDIETNARRGLAYLSESLIKAEGNIELALAGYNGGHSQIYRDTHLWPSETKRYVRYGSAIYYEATFLVEDAHGLETWLKAGGVWLCQQADLHLGLQ